MDFEKLKTKVYSYDKQKRLQRLIEISVNEIKRGFQFPEEVIELKLIQLIRTENGEIDKIKKEREETGFE